MRHHQTPGTAAQVQVDPRDRAWVALQLIDHLEHHRVEGHYDGVHLVVGTERIDVHSLAASLTSVARHTWADRLVPFAERLVRRHATPRRSSPLGNKSGPAARTGGIALTAAPRRAAATPRSTNLRDALLLAAKDGTPPVGRRVVAPAPAVADPQPAPAARETAPAAQATAPVVTPLRLPEPRPEPSLPAAASAVEQRVEVPVAIRLDVVRTPETSPEAQPETALRLAAPQPLIDVTPSPIAEPEPVAESWTTPSVEIFDAELHDDLLIEHAAVENDLVEQALDDVIVAGMAIDTPMAGTLTFDDVTPKAVDSVSDTAMVEEIAPEIDTTPSAVAEAVPVIETELTTSIDLTDDETKPSIVVPTTVPSPEPVAVDTTPRSTLAEALGELTVRIVDVDAVAGIEPGMLLPSAIPGTASALALDDRWVSAADLVHWGIDLHMAIDLAERRIADEVMPDVELVLVESSTGLFVLEQDTPDIAAAICFLEQHVPLRGDQSAWVALGGDHVAFVSLDDEPSPRVIRLLIDGAVDEYHRRGGRLRPALYRWNGGRLEPAVTGLDRAAGRLAVRARFSQDLAIG